MARGAQACLHICPGLTSSKALHRAMPPAAHIHTGIQALPKSRGLYLEVELDCAHSGALKQKACDLLLVPLLWSRHLPDRLLRL